MIHTKFESLNKKWHLRQSNIASKINSHIYVLFEIQVNGVAEARWKYFRTDMPKVLRVVCLKFFKQKWKQNSKISYLQNDNQARDFLSTIQRFCLFKVCFVDAGKEP